MCHRFDPLPQVLKNVQYKKGKPLEDVTVRTAIEDAESSGSMAMVACWCGLRAPSRSFAVMGEGDNRELVEEVVDGVVDALTQRR